MPQNNKEPATKIIDGKTFGYIRPGVYGYPLDKTRQGAGEDS